MSLKIFRVEQFDVTTMGVTPYDIQRAGLCQQPDGSFAKASAKTGRVAPDAERQQDPSDERLAAAPGANPYQKRRFVRLTSIRKTLCDERNLFDKHFVDSLVDAGVLVDDSPRWVQVEVLQKTGIQECVLIEVFDL